MNREDIASLIRSIPDHPRPGIVFRDITSLLADHRGLHACVSMLADEFRSKMITRVAAIEARGFIVGAPLALSLEAGFVPVRKAGKLPGETIGVNYELEYGMDHLEIHRDAVQVGDRVVVVDDLVATGGTAMAAISLVRQLGAEVIGFCSVIDLPDLGGSSAIRDLGIPVHTLVEFGGH